MTLLNGVLTDLKRMQITKSKPFNTIPNNIVNVKTPPISRNVSFAGEI